jgi:steroid delta-isomerase-like uncharacterized protein
MSEGHHELARRFADMVGNRDIDALDTFTAVGHIDHNPAVPDGIEAQRAFWGQVFTAFPDITATLHDLVVEGDRVAARFEYQATHLGPFLGIPASGKQINLTSIDIWRVENGLLAEHWDEMNMGALLEHISAPQESLAAAGGQS